MYAINQSKIWAKYRDMAPKAWAFLSGIPGLRPAASEQIPDKPALAFGTKSQYSAQILSYITN